jgi:hypothetical protein
VAHRQAAHGFWVEFADRRPNPKSWSQFDGVPEDVPMLEGETTEQYTARLLSMRR